MKTQRRSRVSLVLFIVTILSVSLASFAFADNQQRRQPRGARIHFAGKPIYLNAVNMPWNDYARDFGSPTYDPQYFEQAFTQMQGYGVNATRVWVHADGRNSPLFDANGYVTGLPPTFFANMDDFLDRAKAHNIGVILVLWAHEIDGRYNNGIDHTDLILDQNKGRSYLNNVLKPMVKRYKRHPAILAWEVFNEPEFLLPGEQATGRTEVPKEALQRFIGDMAGVVHRNSKQYVTVGAAMYKYMCDKIGTAPPNFAECHGNYWSDKALRKASGDRQAGLDFYQVHYYNWQAPYWFHWTEQGPHYYLDGNKPTIIGEIGIDAQQGKAQAMEDTFRTGYAGHAMWSYWYDPCCGGGWDQIKHELKAFRDAHPNEVDINLNGSNITPTPLPTDTPTPVPSPTPVCSETGTVAIYSDSLDSNWWEGSWDTTVNFANADPVKSGTSSVAITHNGGYAGFNLGVNSALPLGPGDKLRFWVHGGAAGGQTLWVKVNGNETNVFSVPAPAANSWAQVEVPFSFFGGPTSLNGMYIQNGTGDAQSTYYVDDLIVVQASCS